MTKKEAELAFKKGQCPETQGMPGKWAVRIVSGPIPNLPRWHKEFFYNPKTGIDGRNITLGVTWGRFVVFSMRTLCLIDYDVSGAGFLERRIDDVIRTTDDPKVLIGKFYYRFWKRRFMGHFTLTKVEE